MAHTLVPVSGHQIDLPRGRVFHIQKAEESQHDIGVFRPWAGYKDLGVMKATEGAVLFQHVLSYSGSETTGRTGIHTHHAQVHIVIPTSGRGVFSYDGILTEATSGRVIVQHGGTVHDQLSYSYKPSSYEENSKTPLTFQPKRLDQQSQSFSFLEFFAPGRFANVEIVPPSPVTEADTRTAWAHPYHAENARFSLQDPNLSSASYLPLKGHAGLEVRDTKTWEPSGNLVSLWFVRAARDNVKPRNNTATAQIPGEKGGLNIVHILNGSANFYGMDGARVLLNAGDTMVYSPKTVAGPFAPSPDIEIAKFYVSPRINQFRERSAQEIENLERLGSAIIEKREIRPEGDLRPVNFLQGLRIN